MSLPDPPQRPEPYRTDAERDAAVARFTAGPLRVGVGLMFVGLVLLLGSFSIATGETALLVRVAGGALATVALFVLGFTILVRSTNRSPRENAPR